MNITRRDIYQSTKHYLNYSFLYFLVMLICGLVALYYNNFLLIVEVVLIILGITLIEGRKVLRVIVDLIKLDIEIVEGKYFEFIEEKLEFGINNSKMIISTNGDNVLTLYSNDNHRNLKSRNVKVYYTRKSKFLVKIEAINHK